MSIKTYMQNKTKPSAGALRAAEKIMGVNRYVTTPETPIANEFRQNKIIQIAELIDAEIGVKELVDALEAAKVYLDGCETNPCAPAVYHHIESALSKHRGEKEI